MYTHREAAADLCPFAPDNPDSSVSHMFSAKCERQKTECVQAGDVVSNNQINTVIIGLRVRTEPEAASFILQIQGCSKIGIFQGDGPAAVCRDPERLTFHGHQLPQCCQKVDQFPGTEPVQQLL